MTERTLYVEIPAQGYGTTFRKATEEEAELARSFQKRRNELRATIENAKKELDALDKESSKSTVVNVFFDEAGFPYNTRYFVATGGFSTI